MEICKDGAVKAIGTPGGEELALINALARRELGADEVYTFALRLCDNDVDRDFERFGDGTLDQLVPLFVGVSGVFDHQWSAKGQTARIYRTQVVEDGGALTADGRPCRYLKGWAYMMRTQENAALIAEIDGGIKREVSVGCAVDKVLCSICGRELDQCPHEKGEEYGGQVCHGVLTGAADVYEWSFVAVPAQRRAGVLKRFGQEREAERRLQKEAELGRKYLKTLRREVARLAMLADEGLDGGVFARAAERLEEQELLELRRSYEAQVAKRFPAPVQLRSRSGGGGEDPEAFLI